MKRHLSNAMQRRATRFAIFIALVLFFGGLAFQQHVTYTRQEQIHRATTMDFVDNRLAALAADIQEYSLSSRAATASLISFFAAYSVSDVSDVAVYRERLEEYVAARPTAYFVRYVPENGGGPLLSVGEGGDIPSSGTPDSPFNELVEASSTLRNGHSLVSGLTEYTDPLGEDFMLLFAIAPIRHADQTYGYLEFGYTMMPLLDEVAQSRRQDETLVLLDNEGRYLLAPGSERAFTDTLFNDYPPSVTDRIYAGNPADSFIHDGKVFSYRHITVSGIRYGDSDRQYWVLLDIADEAALFAETANLRLEYYTTLGTFALLILIVVGLLLHRRKNPLQDHADHP